MTWAYAVTPDEMAPIFGDTYKGGPGRDRECLPVGLSTWGHGAGRLRLP